MVLYNLNGAWYEVQCPEVFKGNVVKVTSAQNELEFSEIKAHFPAGT